MSYELFEREQRVIDEAKQRLTSGGGDPAEWSESYADLLSSYERLVRSNKRLVRLSDRNQEEINKLASALSEKNDILEVQKEELREAKEHVEEKVRERTQELVESQSKIEKLIEIGIALSAEHNSALLMETILLEAKGLTYADGGTVYVVNEDNKLEFEIMRSDTLNIALGGTTGEPINFPPLAMYDPETGQGNHKNVATHVALTGRTVNIEDAYDVEEFDFSGTKKFDESTGYRSKSFLTVPLKTRQGNVIGVLQLLNARVQGTEDVIAFDPNIQQMVEALSSQAAVALENQKLLEAQKALLDSFIVLMAGAIDAKSPYTGGHCARVPELAKLLAEAACESDLPPFAEFQLTDDEWYEFHIASWLHDCGKVTTPEYVVDKATKLETIYNRIHEIRMRFEVLRRDAEIVCLRQSLENGDKADTYRQEFERTVEQLDDDFAFIADCNVGGEFMADEKVERVRQIGEQTWMRHFDDRIGLAHEEGERKARSPKPALPVEEFLLADKEEHIVYRHNVETPFGDNQHNFQMDVPEHEYNYGEIHNLSIARGTLSDEERYKINHHIVQTIIMLNQLPFPPQLRRVPEYAGGHHETMIGTGYPCKLSKEQMSLPARIMAIADIFEALTASDRPYKKAKTLSEALRIMNFMKKDAHIDSDLFDLFLTKGIYRNYANDFLDPTQIDEVDISPYLSTADSAEAAQ